MSKKDDALEHVCSAIYFLGGELARLSWYSGLPDSDDHKLRRFAADSLHHIREDLTGLYQRFKEVRHDFASLGAPSDTAVLAGTHYSSAHAAIIGAGEGFCIRLWGFLSEAGTLQRVVDSEQSFFDAFLESGLQPAELYSKWEEAKTLISDEFGSEWAKDLGALNVRAEREAACLGLAFRTDSQALELPPKGTYSPAQIERELNISDTTRRRYAEEANVRSNKQGGRDFRYSADERKRILEVASCKSDAAVALLAKDLLTETDSENQQ